ncbi:MAG: hypothetical protein OXE79_04015 [Acidimicrobiaceae bacterium]|nr:hypothetical protein [Acidimicrobiaceae bacterium]MCY4176486.1 hypothetical protein [Acidimicrobiaceae bacterium]MCY4279783.1 hypothetical protein [Acidimicrobiaceae bacterium]MCY4294501.1 hypothetical protein [Acidimicrobiaceae bacterium]
MHDIAHRDRWRAEPLVDPQPIPAPDRVWTADEMPFIRRGFIPRVMEEKWFIFMEQDRLFAHRSWTGLGVYEAEFASVDGGHVIESAVVTGDQSKYRRGEDEYESRTLETLIVSYLLREAPSPEKTADFDWHKNWELAAPRLPKESFLPRVIKKQDPEK